MENTTPGPLAAYRGLIESGAIRLTYEDRARPFNSLEQATHGEGTLSRLLRQEVIGQAEYAHLFGRNRTRLVLAA